MESKHSSKTSICHPHVSQQKLSQILQPRSAYMHGSLTLLICLACIEKQFREAIRFYIPSQQRTSETLFSAFHVYKVSGHGSFRKFHRMYLHFLHISNLSPIEDVIRCNYKSLSPREDNCIIFNIF